MKNFEEIVRDPKDFADRLLFLKQRNKLCDAEIIVNRQRIPVHAIILASSSEYFEDQFINTNPKEKKVTLENENIEVVQLLIEYCYTGRIRVSEKNIKEIIKIANFLLLTPIIENCAKFLEKSLNFSNCLSTWRFARTEHINNLNSIAFEYTKKNFEEVCTSQEFLVLEYSEIKELIKSEINVKSEIIAYNAVKKWIDHDTESRKKYFVDLLKYIRLVHLPLELLFSESLSCSEPDNECCKFFMGALQWKIMNTKRTTSINSKLRDSYSSLVTLYPSNHKSIEIEVFDIKNQKWTSIENVGYFTTNFSAILLEERLILIGGKSDTTISNAIVGYDLKNGTTINFSSMKYARHVPSAVEFKGQVYVMGGNIGDEPSSYVEKLDSKSKSWSNVTLMPRANYGCRARVLGEEIFVVGGFTLNNEYLSELHAYNPESNKWRQCASMNEKRYAPGVAVIGGYLYAVGGEIAPRVVTSSAERYDPKIDKWTMIRSMETSKYWAEAGNLMGNLVIVGGYTGVNGVYTTLSTVEVYDEINDKWKTFASLNKPQALFKMIELPWSLAQLLLNRKI